MSLMSGVFDWLVHSFAACTALLSVGIATVRTLRQPVDRLRVMQWTIAAVFAALALSAAPGAWKLRISTPVLVSAGGTGGLAAEQPSGEPTVVGKQAIRGAQDALSAASESTADGANTDRSLAGFPATRRASPSPDRGASTSGYRAWAAPAIVSLYLVGCCVYAVRTIVARLKLHSLYARSAAASPTVSQEFARIAGAAGSGVRLCSSADLVTPITWGAWRPVIALPSHQIAGDDPRTLSYCLAHEWAHVRRRDAWTWSATTYLQLFLYYHPLFWSLRRQLHLCMDQLADAEAAGEADTPADYAAFLVQLARSRWTRQSQLTLGVTDSRSALKRRVESLLHAKEATRLLCPARRTAFISLVAAALCIAASAVRLEADSAQADETGSDLKSAAADSPAKPPVASAADSEVPNFWPTASEAVDFAKPQIAEWLKSTMSVQADGSVAYIGFVTDAVTERPVAGAVVSVYHKLSRDPKTGGWTTLEITQHETNSIGMYRFVLPPEQVAENSLYIEVDAHHPHFAAKGRSGYSHSMIRKNLQLGELPFYTQIKLWPGEAIEGTLVSPTGEPVKGVELTMYSASDASQGFPRGSFSNAKTDASGRFRLVPATPGDGVLWIMPAEYAPQAHRIANRRGDWGKLQLVKGADVKGKALDVNGDPVANVRIEARRNGDGEEADEFLNSDSVANQIGRTVVSDGAGAFELPSLPDGDYTLEVLPNTDSYRPTPLQQVFVRQKFSVVDGAPLEMTVRAVPHVELRGVYLDSDGKPRSGHQVNLFGRMDGNFYFTRSSTPGEDGEFVIRIPHGLAETKLDLMTNEHSALRWRRSHNEPLQRGRHVQLGVVEDDIDGFEVIRYQAPILLVKAIDSHGDTVSDVTPIATYAQAAGDDEEMSLYTTGSQVSFEAQGDGRHRSSQLLPDEAVSVTVQKEGYETTVHELTLTEGEEREIELKLAPVAGGDSVDEG